MGMGQDRQDGDKPRDQPPAPKSGRDGPNPMSLLGAGVELAAVVGIGTLGGWWLDAKCGTTPWLMIAGLAIGLVGEVYKLWRIGRRFFD
jgi:F0F1-type ATP synthase assembly protein I